ncbi:MAG: HD domain-containing phosphohydrolase, partial [Pseudomonadota bacterium]
MSDLEGKVNPHYLDNVMVVADDREVQATEDIFADNGMKLIAKGKAINRDMRDRLVERKLRKPLEDCMEIASGVTGAQCAKAAEALLDKHQSLRVLCSAPRFNPIRMLSESVFKGRLQTLLTVYAEHRPNKLEHAVSVALLGLGLAHRIQPGAADAAQILLTACMCHDVGELYINPDYLAPGIKLDSQQWRHIAAHPVVAHRLLKDLPGPCRQASVLVLEHHERLDGFGYPYGRRGTDIGLGSQIVGLSEMLSGLLAFSSTPFTQADVAVKLIPGEFSRAIIDLVSQVSRQCNEQAEPTAVAMPQDILLNAAKVARQLGRIEQLHMDLVVQLDKTSPAFKAMIVSARDRFERILRAWSSTGLDAHSPEMLTQQELLRDGDVGREVVMIQREIVWRLRELERELRIRVQN